MYNCQLFRKPLKFIDNLRSWGLNKRHKVTTQSTQQEMGSVQENRKGEQSWKKKELDFKVRKNW